MISILAGFLFQCFVENGQCIMEQEQLVVIQMCNEGQPNHQPPYKKITDGDNTLIIYYVECREA